MPTATRWWPLRERSAGSWRTQRTCAPMAGARQARQPLASARRTRHTCAPTAGDRRARGGQRRLRRPRGPRQPKGAPKWRSSSTTPGKGGGSRRSCWPTSRRRRRGTESRPSPQRCCPHNHRMIEVFRDSGFPVELRSGDEVLEVELPDIALGDGAGALRASASRPRRSPPCRASCAPRSVAVIGASRRRRTVGARDHAQPVARRLHRRRVPGQPACRTPSRASAPTPPSAELPAPVELAVMAVPATQVAAVARECGAAGVRALLVISAGFAETGAEGAARQRELLEICRESGMRLVGPELPGGAEHRARGAPRRDLRGARRRCRAASASSRRAAGSGSRSSTRPAASVSGSHRSCRSATRPTSPATTCCTTGSTTPTPTWSLLYLESFGNPRRFARIARRVSASKPIVAVKSGRSAAGRARHLLAHGRAAGGLRCDGRRAVRAGGRDPHRHDARAVRRRLAAVRPAGAARRARRDRDQRRRSGHPLRGRVPGGWSGGRRARATKCAGGWQIS